MNCSARTVRRLISVLPPSRSPPGTALKTQGACLGDFPTFAVVLGFPAAGQAATAAVSCLRGPAEGSPVLPPGTLGRPDRAPAPRPQGQRDGRALWTAEEEGRPFRRRHPTLLSAELMFSCPHMKSNKNNNCQALRFCC